MQKFKDDEQRLHHNTFWFQNQIVKEYFKVLQKDILEKSTESEILIFERTQRSTKLFSEFNGLTKEEIILLNKNDKYWDQIINKSIILYIKTSNKRMKKNLNLRQREQEKSLQFDYCKNLRKFYKKKLPQIYLNQTIIEINNKKDLNSKKNEDKLKKKLHKIFEDLCTKNDKDSRTKQLGNTDSTK